jgi:hypothetical protein
MLKSQGIDQARIFMDRQAARLQRHPVDADAKHT